ncbi:MAG: aminoacyl-tRNA hydrolase [Bdellovibrionales bacterium RBG_16_40_8]|nr:MAG: aminoacyl-tRNA hydrolase [Bdellovibrionales bacterium RBG_16_40_8]
MFLIVGLGNPGIKYKLNRHNIGFIVVDVLAMHLQIKLKMDNDYNALIGHGRIGEEDVILCEPQTYMNLSGESVQSIVTFFKIPLDKLLVIHDEVDLSFGQLRFQKNRGHNGHNGVRNIHEKIGSDYSRLRVGVGRPAIPQMSVADFVLQNFSREQEAELSDFVGSVCDAALDFCEEGLEKTQAKYNSGEN